MTISRKPVVERAFELAKSGEYTGIREIRERLSREGYTQDEARLYGRELAKSLLRLCAEARGGPR